MITHFKFNTNVERNVVTPDDVNLVHLACRQKIRRQRRVLEAMENDYDNDQ